MPCSRYQTRCVLAWETHDSYWQGATLRLRSLGYTPYGHALTIPSHAYQTGVVFAALDLFSRVVAAFVTRLSRFHTLPVDHSSGQFRSPSSLRAYLCRIASLIRSHVPSVVYLSK